MQKITMCRICLVKNVNMYEVANKDLQKTYEKLTDIPFVTEDCRPMLACFFCYAKLKQCCQLLRKSLKAEEVFAQMLNGDYEQIPIECQSEMEFCGGLIKTSVEYMSIGADTEQLPAVCDIKDEIELKEEYLTFEVECLEDSYQNQEDTPSHQSELDSKDDPLLNLNEEKEVPEKNTRAPVAKKPKLGIWEVKLEDAITEKQKKNCLYPMNNCNLNKDEKIIDESNTKNVKEEIKTDIDTNYCNNSIQDHFGCKIFNDKGLKHKKICKPYTCDVCQRSFNQKSHLNDHVRVHTGEKPYKCDICQRSFNKKCNLNEHIRIHTGEKPFKCDNCQRSFNQKSHLNDHIRLHTGEKPYKCDICQRSFNKKSHLKSHHKTHCAEKPYNCDVCQRSFSLKINLDKHVRAHW